jgi:hypothetical protein
MFNFIDIYSFFPVCGGVDMGHSALFSPGAYNAVKPEYTVLPFMETTESK